MRRKPVDPAVYLIMVAMSETCRINRVSIEEALTGIIETYYGSKFADGHRRRIHNERRRGDLSLEPDSRAKAVLGAAGYKWTGTRWIHEGATDG